MKNLAIFDLDHTLIHTDSDNAFPKFLIEQGLLDADYAAAQNEKFYQDYLSGCLNVADFVRFQISPIAHLTPAQRNELHQQFQAQYIAPQATNCWLSRPPTNTSSPPSANKSSALITSSARS